MVRPCLPQNCLKRLRTNTIRDGGISRHFQRKLWCTESTRLALLATMPDSWRNIPISNNVGSVKHDLSTRPHALREERHFVS